MGKKLYKIGEFVLDSQKRCFFYENKPMQLSSRAFDILSYLIEKKGEIVEKEDLLQKVWADSFVEEGNLAVHIYALRRMLGEKKGESNFIRTISGRGYSFIAPVTEINSPKEVREIQQQFSDYSVSDVEENLSIAVMPFSFTGGKEDNEYLANGITQSVISDLSQISNLRVLAYSAVKHYKNSELELQEIGFLLGVEKILIGNISEYKNKYEISVELINASDRRCVWGTEHIFDSADIFEVKKEISIAIAEKLKLKLQANDNLRKISQREINAEAQKLYFRGKFILESRTTKKKLDEILPQALKYFREAVKIEPNYALAYVGIGKVYASMHNHNLLNRDQAYTEAKKALQIALLTNNQLSEVYVLKASIEIMLELNFTEAKKSLEKAIELNPNNPEAYHWKSYICICLGNFDEAIELELKATQTEPTLIVFNEALTRIFFFARDYNKAIIQAEELIEFDEKTVTSYFFMALSYAYLGFFDLALINIEKAIEIRNSPETLLNKAFIYCLAGNKERAEEILAEVLTSNDTYLDYTDVALVYCALNQIETALDCLEKAFDSKSVNLGSIKIDRRLEKLWNHPRFENLIRKLNLA